MEVLYDILLLYIILKKEDKFLRERVRVSCKE